MERQRHHHKHTVRKHPTAHSQTHGESPLPVEYEDAYELEHDVKTILSWHASGRPFRERSFEFFLNSFLIMMAVEIILFLFSQYLLMMVVFSLLFLSFALAVVPPRPFYYKITTEGIRIEDHVFIWDELYDFYFMKQHGQDVLHVSTKDFFPGELVITLGDMSPDHVKAAILPYLPFREYVKPSFLERASEWLEQNFPLEKRY